MRWAHDKGVQEYLYGNYDLFGLFEVQLDESLRRMARDGFHFLAA